MDLQISRAGTGYTLRFIAVNIFGSPLAFTYSDEFDVALGNPYTLVFNSNFGPFFGGTPSENQPSVSIRDRGGNVITTVNEGTAFIDLYSSPYSGEELLTTGTKMATFSGGVAQFEGLYINQQGGPYIFVVNSTLVSPFAIFILLFNDVGFILRSNR